MLILWLIYIGIGSCAGFLAGMLGIGGGLIIVPTLLYFFSRQGISGANALSLAIGTSLAIIIITSISAMVYHSRYNAINWPVFKKIAVTTIIGALLLGPSLHNLVSAKVIYCLFSIICLKTAWQVLFNDKKNITTPNNNEQRYSTLLVILGIPLGALCMLTGVGGGSVTASLLKYYNLSLREVIGTTAALTVPISLTGTITYIVSGWFVQGLPEYSLGFIYLPAFFLIALSSALCAPLGTKVSYMLNVRQVQKTFGIFLIFIAIKMIVSI